MRDLFLGFLIVFLVGMVGGVCSSVVFGDEGECDGVIAAERVIDLPQDQGKWYISVIGSCRSRKFYNIKKWFDSGQLLELRKQVHYNTVDSRSAKYYSRYKNNVSGLPTIRLQEPGGGIVYEVHGNSIPMTASGLYGAMANAINRTQAPILPWRRKHVSPDDKCGPDGCPMPDREEEEVVPSTPFVPEKPIVPAPRFELGPWGGGVIAIGIFFSGVIIGLISSAKQLFRKF